MASEIKVVMNPAAVAWMLRSPTGPVGRELLRTAKRVQFTARQLAPKGMRAGITASMDLTNPLGPAVKVTSTHPATMFIINGTKAHGPKTAKVMHFYIDGREVWAHWVKGITANDFLAKSLLLNRI